MTRHERYMADVDRMAAETQKQYSNDPRMTEMYRAAVMDNRIRDLLKAIEREHPDSIILRQIDGWLDYVEAVETKEKAA